MTGHLDSNPHSTQCDNARTIRSKEGGVAMFLILAIVLVVMWLGGFLMFHTAGFLIHLLLLFAVISLVMHFVTGRRAA
ncbi:MAG TPA: lmo0937 family membrane protein [Acidobacteriaceae bacterium]